MPGTAILPCCCCMGKKQTIVATWMQLIKCHLNLPKSWQGDPAALPASPAHFGSCLIFHSFPKRNGTVGLSLLGKQLQGKAKWYFTFKKINVAILCPAYLGISLTGLHMSDKTHTGLSYMSFNSTSEPNACAKSKSNWWGPLCPRTIHTEMLCQGRTWGCGCKAKLFACHCH